MEVLGAGSNPLNLGDATPPDAALPDAATASPPDPSPPASPKSAKSDKSDEAGIGYDRISSLAKLLPELLNFCQVSQADAEKSPDLEHAEDGWCDAARQSTSLLF